MLVVQSSLLWSIRIHLGWMSKWICELILLVVILHTACVDNNLGVFVVVVTEEGCLFAARFSIYPAHERKC